MKCPDLAAGSGNGFASCFQSPALRAYYAGERALRLAALPGRVAPLALVVGWSGLPTNRVGRGRVAEQKQPQNDQFTDCVNTPH